jgi:dCTP deaminase
MPVNKNGFMLEVGIPYLIPIEESLSLPKSICARANNKSSSGRINLQIRLLCNGNREFDSVPSGYSGPLYIVAIAKSFPVHIKPGETFNQIRFYSSNVNDSRLVEYEIESAHRKYGLMFDLNSKKIPWKEISLINSSIVLTANLKGKVAAYRFKGVATDGLWYCERNVNSSHFFEPIAEPKDDEHFVLSKGGFYIVSTLEAFCVPPKFCSEMVAYNTGIGEYRSHFAGFFDPGWGYGEDTYGRAAVLEIIPHEDILLKHGQPVCLMELYKMDKEPDKVYGKSGNNYFEQKGPKLGKQFAYK